MDVVSTSVQLNSQPQTIPKVDHSMSHLVLQCAAGTDRFHCGCHSFAVYHCVRESRDCQEFFGFMNIPICEHAVSHYPPITPHHSSITSHHSSITPHHSPITLTTLPSPLTTLPSPLTILPSPLTTLPSPSLPFHHPHYPPITPHHSPITLTTLPSPLTTLPSPSLPSHHPSLP